MLSQLVAGSLASQGWASPALQCLAVSSKQVQRLYGSKSGKLDPAPTSAQQKVRMVSI
jgi:hypothetical protein